MINTASFQRNKEVLFDLFDRISEFFIYRKIMKKNAMTEMCLERYPYGNDHYFSLIVERRKHPIISVSIEHCFQKLKIERLSLIFNPVDLSKKYEHDTLKSLFFTPTELHPYSLYIFSEKDYFDFTTDDMNWPWLINQLKFKLVNLT